MRRLAIAVLLLSAASLRAEDVSFDRALTRALQTRGVDTAFAAGISRLEAPFGPMLPTLRAELSAQRAENIELLSAGAVRFDALTMLLSADYPLLERVSRNRRLALARTSAQLFRRRALDEADEVFRETLDAFTNLYIAQRRLELLAEGVRHAGLLRERARKLLELGQITNTTAANWEEQALVTESRRLDYELARLDAETRLRQLLGDTTNAPLRATIDLDGVERGAMQTVSLERLVERDAMVDSATLNEVQRRLVLEELQSQRRPQLLLSAFGGVAAVPESFSSNATDGSYGIYGLRLSLTLPSLNAANATRLAEAQLELEQATRAKNAAAAAMRTRGTLLAQSIAAAGQRIAILRQQIDLAKRRQESIARLVREGVRTESDLAEAINEIARRESDLVAMRVERWRLDQTARQLQTRQKAAMVSAGAAGNAAGAAQ